MTNLKHVEDTDLEQIKTSIQEIIENAIEKIKEINAESIKELKKIGTDKEICPECGELFDPEDGCLDEEEGVLICEICGGKKDFE